MWKVTKSFRTVEENGSKPPTPTEPPDYDVRERIQQLNTELEAEEDPGERQHRVNFKDDLVDLVAPPPEYPTEDEESESAGQASPRPDSAVPEEEGEEAEAAGAAAGAEEKKEEEEERRGGKEEDEEVSEAKDLSEQRTTGEWRFFAMFDL